MIWSNCSTTDLEAMRSAMRTVHALGGAMARPVASRFSRRHRDHSACAGGTSCSRLLDALWPWVMSTCTCVCWPRQANPVRVVGRRRVHTYATGAGTHARLDALRHCEVVDTHTAGEPTRVFLDPTGSRLARILSQSKNRNVAAGHIRAPTSMRARQRLLQSEHDALRRFLLQEPRGHRDMFGAFVGPPSQENASLADFGVVFADGGG